MIYPSISILHRDKTSNSFTVLLLLLFKSLLNILRLGNTSTAKGIWNGLSEKMYMPCLI